MSLDQKYKILMKSFLSISCVLGDGNKFKIDIVGNKKHKMMNTKKDDDGFRASSEIIKMLISFTHGLLKTSLYT